MTGVPDQAMRLTCMTQGVEVPDLRERCITQKQPATQLPGAIQA